MKEQSWIITQMGVTGFDGEQEVNGACRALGVSLNLREKHNCQRTIGSRSLIDCDVSPFFVCGHGRGATLAGWSKAGAQRLRMRTFWASGHSKPANGRGWTRILKQWLHT